MGRVIRGKRLDNSGEGWKTIPRGVHHQLKVENTTKFSMGFSLLFFQI